jgi:hypothetical protein
MPDIIREIVKSQNITNAGILFDTTFGKTKKLIVIIEIFKNQVNLIA